MTTAADLGMAPILLPSGQEVWVRRGEPMAKATLTVNEPGVTTTALTELAKTLGSGSTTLGPGMPISPMHAEEGQPRRWDYRPGTNIAPRPRQDETYSFATLRAFSRNYDVARLCIEKRKDDLRSLQWSVRSRPVDGATRAERIAERKANESALNEATGFLLSPDQELMWGPWLMKWAEDLFSIDAATIYLRPTLGGDLYALEVVDGSTIKVLLDPLGRPPMPPEPAYAQAIKGMPWGWYDRSQMVYAPYWPQPHSPYGSPPIEWVMMAANRALRRQTLDLARFTEGNVPTALLRMPADWNMQQLKEFYEWIGELMAGNDVARARMLPVPGGEGTGAIQLNAEPTTEGEEWLMYLTCWAYGVNPSEVGFTKSGSGLGGKGFAEVGQDLSFRRSIRNPALHLKGILDSILSRVPRWSKLEMFCPELEQAEDREAKAKAHAIYLDHGVVSGDEIREDELDREPIGLGAYIAGQVTLVSELMKPPEAIPAALAPFAGQALTQPSSVAGTEGTPGDAAPETPSAEPGENTEDTSAGEPDKAPMGKAAGLGDDLGRWERKAIKALRDGRSAAVRFESDVIPRGMTEHLRDRLAKASDVADVRGAFSLAKAAGESDAPLAVPLPASAISSPAGSLSRVGPSWAISDSGRRLYP